MGKLLFQVLFISEKMVIGVGYDSNPMVFAADDTGIWCVTLRNICLKFSFLGVCIQSNFQFFYSS